MAEVHAQAIQGQPMKLGPPEQLKLPVVGDDTLRLLFVSGVSCAGAYFVTKKTDTAIGFALLAGLVSKYYFMTPIESVEQIKVAGSPSQPHIRPFNPPIFHQRDPMPPNLGGPIY